MITDRPQYLVIVSFITKFNIEIGSINLTEEGRRLTMDQIPYKIDLEKQQPVDLLSSPSQHKSKGK